MYVPIGTLERLVRPPLDRYWAENFVLVGTKRLNQAPKLQPDRSDQFIRGSTVSRVGGEEVHMLPKRIFQLSCWLHSRRDIYGEAIV